MEIEKFVDYLDRRPDRSTNTVKAYRSDLALFRSFLETRGLRVNQVKPQVIQEYIRELQSKPNLVTGQVGLSRATVRRRLIAIRKYYEFLRVTVNPKLRDPTYGFSVGDLNNDDCKAVDESTLAKLIAGITVPRDRAVILLFLSSGLRLSELHQLNRDSISVEQQTDEGENERVLGTGEVIGKRLKKRRFYIDVDAVDSLADYLATRRDSHPALFLSERKRRMSKRCVEDTLARWCRKLGIPHVHPHQLRHSYATRLANANIDSMVLKTLMGHEDLRTTARYVKLYDHTIARQYYAAMETLRP